MFKEGNLIYYHDDVKDIEILVNYLRLLKGDLSKYKNTENRINIK